MKSIPTLSMYDTSWSINFQSAFKCYERGKYVIAMIQCRHYISRFCDSNSNSLVETLQEIAYDLESTLLGKHMIPHGENCKCLVPTDIEVSRWMCLRAFILFRMVRNRSIEHEPENIREVRQTLIDIKHLVHHYKLCNDPEFAYLVAESSLKKCTMDVDYVIGDPWVTLKQLRRLQEIFQNDINAETTEQARTTLEYIDRIQLRCMADYIRKTRGVITPLASPPG